MSLSLVKKSIVVLIPFVIIATIALWPAEQFQEGDFPFITTQVQGFTNSKLYLIDGLVVKGNTNTMLPVMYPWGVNNGLTIEPSSKYEVPFFVLNGTSLDEPVGFSSEPHYEGKYLSIIVGDVNKSREAYVSFSFVVQGQNGDYFVAFTHSSSTEDGWVNMDYYERIDTRSSRLINLEALLSSRSDKYLRVVEFNIIVAKNLVVMMDFRLDLDKTTENLPSSVPESSWVFGNASHEGRVVCSKIVFHNLGAFSYLKIEYLKSSNDFQVDSGKWTLLDIEDNGNSLLLIVEQRIETYELTPASFRNIDVVVSLNLFVKTDWLFFILLGFIICSPLIGPHLERHLGEK